MADARRVFRLCVDLNVWVAWFLSAASGMRGTAAQSIIEAVQDGRGAVGPIQLVVSHAMLTRLTDVLIRKGISIDHAHRNARLIASLAQLGPSQESAHVVLGGGVEPTREDIPERHDPYDPGVIVANIDREDGGVLDTALAGRADALVTANLKDFRHHQDLVIVEGRILIRRTATQRLVIIRPQEMAAWLRTGVAPIHMADRD